MVYSILAQAVSAPSEALCRAVEEGEFCALLNYAMAGTPLSHRREIRPDLLDKFAADPAKGSFAELILIEYTRLFSSSLHCPQYEGDCLARSPDSVAHVIASVVNMYSTFGVKLANDVRERPDHIAVELDFMNFLATKEAHACNKGQKANARLCRRAQTRFFGDHLSRWGSAFASNLGDVTSLKFYDGVCELLEAFLLAEAKYLKVEPRVSAIEEESHAASQQCGCSRCADTLPEQQNGLVSIAGLGKDVLK